MASLDLLASNSNKSTTSKGDERFGQRTRKTVEATDYYYYDVSELPNDMTNLIIPIKEIGNYKVKICNYVKEYGEYFSIVEQLARNDYHSVFNWSFNTNLNDTSEKWIDTSAVRLLAFRESEILPLLEPEEYWEPEVSIPGLEENHILGDFYSNELSIREEGKTKYFNIDKYEIYANPNNRLIAGQSKIIFKNLITGKEYIQEVNVIEKFVNYPAKMEITGPEGGKLKVSPQKMLFGMEILKS